MKLEEALTRPPLARRAGVLDFIGDDDGDYCANFGLQWTRFRSVQLDSVSGSQESHQRFVSETGWHPDELRGKVLLDAGCGSGRFAEVALELGARVIAVDMSEAVHACHRSLERFPRENWLVLRADVLNLPLRREAFDGVYSLGVVHHTPDPLKAVRVLASFVRPGGRLAVWVYERRSPDFTVIQPRRWIRSMTRRWSDQRKLRMARVLTLVGFPIGWALSRFGRTGERVAHFLPYAARHHLAPHDFSRQWTYSLMDTFDWYGPRYELPQCESDVMAAMHVAGLRQVRRLGEARGMAIVGEAPANEPAATREPVE